MTLEVKWDEDPEYKHFQAYKTIYESSTGFGCRKALMAANDEHETAAHIKRLTEEISNLQEESNELTCEYFSSSGEIFTRNLNL